MKTNANGKSMTRRQFAQVFTGGAAALAMTGLLGCTPKSELPSDIAKTYTCDVLVVGGGGAGVTAAGQAANAGAKTILIEKMSWLAGSSSLAIGTLYGAGTKLQEAAGIHDTPEGLLEYFLASNGDKLDYDIEKFCADHFGETIDWLMDEMGVPFKATVSKKGKDTVARGHNINDHANIALEAVAAYAHQVGVDFHFGMAAKSLVTTGSAVTGVLARDNMGNLIQYNAKKTIISSGGFCRNADMIDNYMPDYTGVYTEVGVGCTGEGLQMGLDLGADYVGHGGTNGILACPVEPGQSKLISSSALWVNTAGNRFANEGGQTHDIYYQVAHFDDQKFYAIYDQALVDSLSAALKKKVQSGLDEGIFAKAETVSQAAQKLGVNGDNAQISLDSYNALAAAGADTQYKKKADYLKPLTTPPYYVMTMGVCTHGSFGGYRVNTDFQVLDKSGSPIPNLYSAGEVCCGTFIYDDYPAGGCGLNWSYTSGRYSGNNAAAAALGA